MPRPKSIPGVFTALLIIVLALGNCTVAFYPYGTAVWIRPLFSLLAVAGMLLAGVGWWRILLGLR